MSAFALCMMNRRRRLSILVMLAICVCRGAAEHESTLCGWLGSKMASYAIGCFLGFSTCSLEGITCTTIDSVTYYSIDLSGEGLSGTLPPNLSSIGTMKKLLLDDNAFTGTLPASWSGLSNLEELSIYNSSLTGSLPDSWSALSSLVLLDLRHNSLTGTLPVAWQALSSMERLKVSSNELSGGLPSEWSSWTGLKRLRLDKNDLTGPLPASWSVFGQLIKLNVSYNQLTGEIPASWASLSVAHEGLFFDGNPELVCSAPSTWTSDLYSCAGTASDGYLAAEQEMEPPQSEQEGSIDTADADVFSEPSEPPQDEVQYGLTLAPASEVCLEGSAPAEVPFIESLYFDADYSELYLDLDYYQEIDEWIDYQQGQSEQESGSTTEREPEAGSTDHEPETDTVEVPQPPASTETSEPQLSTEAPNTQSQPSAIESAPPETASQHEDAESSSVEPIQEPEEITPEPITVPDSDVGVESERAGEPAAEAPEDELQSTDTLEIEEAPEPEIEASSPEPAEAPETLPVVDPSINYCSAEAITCQATLRGFYEELLLGSDYSLSTAFSGRTVYGLKSVDTSSPTRPAMPLTITIPSEDPCSAELPIVLEIAVLCPEHQFYCETDDSTFCSSSQLCINLNPLTEDLDSYNTESLPFNGPMISLNGPETIQITVGESYTACEQCEDVASTEVCDAGAVAWDEVEGQITPWIEACSSEEAVHYFDNVGLNACGLDTSAVGFYNITFSVRDSAGQAASVQRQLAVLPDCPEGEIVCMEVLECSIGGSCFLYTGKVTETVETDLDSLNTMPVVQNNTLELILTNYAGLRVNVTVGASYDKCQDDAMPTGATKCEPGVNLTIFPDQPTAYEIYACPSGPCRHAGVEFCEASLFAIHGLAACNLDTHAAPGTQHEIQFMAIPSNNALPTLFVSRFLILESLCSPSEYQCDDTCSPVPCDYYTIIIHDATPVLQSNFPDGLSLAYGVSSAVSILPCSLQQTCGVHAQDEEDGDLGESVVVIETTACTEDRDACRFCDPSYVSSGDCLPGLYTYQYSVEDSAGNTADPVTLEVNIVEVSEFVISLTHVSMDESLEASYGTENPEIVSSIKASVLNAIETALQESGKQTSLNSNDFAVSTVDGVLQLQTCFVGMMDRVASANVTIGQALQTADPSVIVPTVFNSSEPTIQSFNRRLLQATTDEASFEDAIGVAGELVTQVDVRHLNLVLNGTRSALLTEEVDYTLGAIVSVLGELEALYQESVSQVALLVESVRAALPDTTQIERQLMNSIENLFLEKRNYDQRIIDALNSTESFDSLNSSLEELLNATRSAAKDTAALINAQLMEMSHLRNYQGFLAEVDLLAEEYTCIDTAEEKRFTFNIPVEEGDGSSRKLLQSRSGSRTNVHSPGTSSSADESDNIWGAYTLNVPDLSAFGPNANATSMETMLRGATNHRNFIIGGVVIQTERSTKNHICYGRFAHLIEYCYAIPLHKQDMSQIPYGRDPVFLVDSILYDEESAMRTEKYYNPQGENAFSTSGIPFGFQPSEVKGSLGTHYVYLDIQFGRVTVAKLLQYLKEGQFLDAMTDTVVLRFVTYNPQFPATILGVNEVKCSWKHEIECDYKVDALPDIKWTDTTTIITITVISILLSMYWIAIGRRFIPYINREGVSFVLETMRANIGDLMVVSVMTISLCMSMALVGYEVSELGPRLRFDIYDSSRFYGAHWLLPRRNDTQNVETGERWMLPENVTDIHRLADFLESMSQYRRLASLSSILQTFAIVAVILRLICLASKLPRVSLITSTLKASILPMLYFMGPFSIVMTTFAVIGAVCFGHRVESLSSFSKAMETVLEFTFFGGGDLVQELTPEGIILRPMELGHAVLFKISLSCLSIFIFLNFALAIITDAFLDEKAQTTDSKDTGSDLSFLGKEILSEIASFQKMKRKRSKQIIPSLSDIATRRTEASQSKKTSFTSTPDRPQTGDFVIKPRVSEIEMSSSRVIYINDGPYSSDDEGEDYQTSIPLRRLDEVSSQRLTRKSGKHLSTELQCIERRVNDLLETYESARLWAVQARFELAHQEWLQQSSS